MQLYPHTTSLGESLANFPYFTDENLSPRAAELSKGIEFKGKGVGQGGEQLRARK